MARKKRSNQEQKRRTGLIIVGLLVATVAGYGMYQLVLTLSLSWPVTAYIVVSFIASLIAFGAYWFDKFRASNRGRRIPENTLHVIELLGGWPGALIAQQLFRHKTKKLSFRIMFWMIVMLHVGLILWLIW